MSRKSAVLLRRVERMMRKLTAPQAPRDYVMILEEDEEVSEALRAQLGPHDQLTIRYYPKNFAPDLRQCPQSMSCELREYGGQRRPYVVYG